MDKASAQEYGRDTAKHKLQGRVSRPFCCEPAALSGDFAEKQKMSEKSGKNRKIRIDAGLHL